MTRLGEVEGQSGRVLFTASKGQVRIPMAKPGHERLRALTRFPSKAPATRFMSHKTEYRRSVWPEMGRERVQGG
jgi:hypothetical protein